MLNMLDNLEFAYAEQRRLARRDFIYGVITRKEWDTKRNRMDMAYTIRWCAILAAF